MSPVFLLAQCASPLPVVLQLKKQYRKPKREKSAKS